MTTSIGERMKENYENRYRIKLTRRMPVIIRLDGKCFHKITHLCDKPFDRNFSEIMCELSTYLLEEIQGSKFAYTQSDEISILLTDFDKLDTDAWFDYNIQKMVSISASMASVYFSAKFGQTGLFDSRVFNIPKEEVCNYFVWRQKDWVRNSLQMLGRAHFSHKELDKKKSSDIHEMLHIRNVNWSNLADKWKNGVCTKKILGECLQSSDFIFTKDRLEIEEYLNNEIVKQN